MTPDQLVTQEQLKNLMVSWKCDQPIPKKNQCVYITFAGNPVMIRITKTDKRATYGGSLYNIHWFKFVSVGGKLVEEQC
jgi:hypothetical protein